jgi:ABC-type amino acid transport substrate-binding protein
MRILIALLLVGILFVACSTPAPVIKLRVVAEDFPPYNYVDENGVVTGQSTGIVRAIMSQIGENTSIEVMPWERAYELLQKEPGVALYSTARTPDRENMFLWVGPLVNYEKYLYARKGSGIKINSLADVKNVKAIAGVKNEAGMQGIIDQGGKVIYVATGYEALKKVMDGSADICLAPGADLSVAAKKAGVNLDEIEPIFLLHEYDFYIAFNKNTPPAIVKQWQQALDSLKQEDKLKSTMLQIQKAVQLELDNLDRDLSGAASKLSRIGLSGSEARQILNELSGNHPFLIDCSTVDVAGKMVTVAPEAYSRYEGSDISTQDTTIQFNAVKKPALSRMFKALESTDAIVLMRPIFSEKGDFMGSTSALFTPETLAAHIVESVLKGDDVEVNLIQLDGLTIFSSTGEMGKNILRDPEFKPYGELVALGARMVDEESGMGSYTIISHTTGKMVKKQVFWDSIKLHDTAWRLLSIQAAAE